MSLAMDRVHQGDCVQLLKKVDEGSVDLVFADPPFNIGYDYDVYDDRREAGDYLEWSKSWIEGVKRVLKPDGTFWLAIGDEFAAEMKVLCTRDLGFHCRSWVIWFFTFGVHCKNKFTRSHTHLFHFVKDPKKFTFNSLDIRVPSARELVYGDKRADPNGRVPDDTWMMPPGDVETSKRRNVETDPSRDREGAVGTRDQGIEGSRDRAARDKVAKGRRNGGKSNRRNSSIAKLPDYSITKSPNHAIARSPHHETNVSALDDSCRLVPAIPPEAPTRDGFILRPQDIPDRFPPHSDVWFFSRVAGTFKERRGWHGCQMPEQLLGRIIRACSNEGDIVLDPFAGSGTTLAVAKKLRRRFVGSELSKEYACQVETRLATITPGDALTGPADALSSAPKTANGRILDRSNPRLPVKRGRIKQRSIARQEAAELVVSAFRSAHRGHSADRVIADPSLNDDFLAACGRLGIPGGPGDWNHLLMNVRKRGELTAIPTTRADSMSRATMDSFVFASEMAWRHVARLHDCTLDDLLCDPSLASEFDSVARRIGPGRTSFEYRWGALSVRKAANLGTKFRDQVKFRMPRSAIRLDDRKKLPVTPGHYVIMNDNKCFYVGAAESLRMCSLFRPTCLLAALAVFGTKESSLTIRTPSFEPANVSMAWRAAQRAALLTLEPVANVPFPINPSRAA